MKNPNAKLTKILKRSLKFAHIDAQARKEKRFLFSDLKVPKSHFVITDLNDWSAQNTLKVVRDGFDTLKVKMGKSLKGETILLKAFVNLVERPEKLQMTDKKPIKLRLRLDFNGKMNRSEFESWWDGVKSWLYPLLDFIEDPFLYDKELWDEISQQYQINFAVDRSRDLDLKELSNRHVVVIKPAVDDIDELIQVSHGKSMADPSLKELHFDFIFTSYMDHPIGQACAAYESAQVLKQFPENVLECGLHTHHLYEETEFSRCISQSKGVLQFKEGTGFGFDQPLSQIQWNDLE